MNEAFNKWWNEDLLTEDNPYVDGSYAYWAWEGWCAGVKAEREAFNKERQQYADWLDEASADIEDWGMYASEYLQQKWDLPDQVQNYKNRAAAIRARGNT
jgi:hypothetical protein